MRRVKRLAARVNGRLYFLQTPATNGSGSPATARKRELDATFTLPNGSGSPATARKRVLDATFTLPNGSGSPATARKRVLGAAPRRREKESERPASAAE
ncbi:MAG: hypothetical protein Q4G69_03890 [Planctomycetia bacterium]|nr:hypothetical protein [Planctomycetia bacterium]